MKVRIALCAALFGLIAVGAMGCSSPSDEDLGDGTNDLSKKGATEIKSSVAYTEAQTIQPTDANAAKLYAIMQFSTLTPCDLMLWADTVDPALETDPANFAAWGAGGTVRASKKKMSYESARILAGTYMTFQGSNAQVTEKVQKTWVTSFLNYATAAGTKITSVNKSTTGGDFSTAAINECNVYLTSIKSSTWGCLQYLVSDYLAVKADRTNLDTSADLLKFPFYSWVAPKPGNPVTPATDELRQYVLPTVSYRTIKALSGYWPKIGKQKELHDLAAEAVDYFRNNEFDDYRAKAAKPGKANWVGYFETAFDGSGKVQPFCSFDDAAAELGK